jgi:hypothetical protein
MGRSALAILGAYLIFSAGAVLIFQLSGRDPRVFPERGFLLLSVAGGMALAVVAGYAAGAIARRAEVGHAAFLALLMAAVAVTSIISKPGSASRWSETAVVFLMSPAAILGGVLRRKLKQ